MMPSKNKDDLYLEGQFDLENMHLAAIEELEKLAPFGPGNPEPLFALSARVTLQSVLKGRHLKVKLHAAHSQPRPLEGIWFNAAERLESTELVEISAQEHKSVLIAGIPEINRFMGRVTPTFRIKEAKFNQ
jgi:single-stranded DNA-specific DHH superfamily exonuclease